MAYGSPSRPTMPAPVRGPGMAIVSLVLGLFGFVVWLLPIDETGVRHYLPFPFALGGLVLAIICLAGRNRGKVMAALGAIFSVLALLLGLVMVANEFLGLF